MGVVNGIGEFVPHIITQGHGHIVNTASLAGLMTSPTLSAYCVSKHAVVALSECLCHDLALVGAPINVSVLCPGPVSSRIHLESGRPVSNQEQNLMVKLVSDAITAQMPLGKSARETAEAALTAVLNNEFWALPDTEILPNINVRLEEIRQQSGLNC
jgi:short-subunit dehydrogenase